MKHEFVARASSMGSLMTNDRSGKKMGETAITLIKQTVLYNKYGIEKDISSKYLDKGIQNEYESIKLAAGILGWFDVDPDEPKTRFFNDYATGEPDVLSATVLGDIKNSFDGTTFPFFETECFNKAYDWQMQCYMWLTGRKQAELVYTLTDTPEQMILDEIRRKAWKAMAMPKYADMNIEDIEVEIESQVRNQMMFGHIPEEKRVKRFIIEADENKFEMMQNRIIEAREIYDKLYQLV